MMDEPEFISLIVDIDNKICHVMLYFVQLVA